MTTDDTWVMCSGCRAMLYGKRFARNLKVCPDCGHHHRLTAAERVEQLFDPGSIEVLEFPARSEDVLEFFDTKPYPQRLEQARRATGLGEGVLVAAGTIDGLPLIAAVMDFGFLGGTIGAAVGELITSAAEEALGRRVPLLISTASGGARMQEGPISLMQMVKTSQALTRLDEAGILTIALITDPTFGGVAASFATQCDVIIAEPGARLGFAGRRVIEQTIRSELPDDFQTAEFLRERGLINMIKPRSALRSALRKLLAVTVPRAAGRSPAPGPDVLVRDPDLLSEIDPWQAVQQARNIDRPTTLDYIERAFSDFEELHGDRIGGECQAIVGGVARLGDRPVVVIGHQRGRTAAELTARNFGMPTPAGYRKAARLMVLAAKLRLPLVTFVDTPGAYPGMEAEERGQAMAIAQCIRLMTGLPIPMVTVIIGEGGSGGALALAVANEVLISEHGVYSVISPEGCASILWKDASMAPTAARALKMDARNLLRLKVVDGVIREPAGGSQADHIEAAGRVAGVLHATLARLDKLGKKELIEARRDRFRPFGSALDQELRVTQ
ncbi:MAG TPA: acetyl-CoA carboxylase carboxyltransferase subunit alpha [Actinophytocola sp.]|uniref:acetyl-CoA carboxylase carboxyltransferase subunit alpha n=1 Tax=Actinophytocola sp. TaxID=1872138 RepID=UPI002DDD0979|nr:acetyl-CoA carboxylase carboxyltransferase subunit alpha [Actinophytocola sp.]HEV2780501.1 acetyl-CoA carboxylase carboxyltransferase subunit alpha [Actinophytocola sp.]